MHHLSGGRREVDGLERQLLGVGKGRTEPGEGASDPVQPVDLGQNPRRRFIERRFKSSRLRLPPHPLQMLNAEANRRQGILDFVRHLPRHFSPGEHARGPRQRRRVVERDDTAIRRGAEQCELQPDLSTADVELTLGDHVAVCGDELGDRLPHRCPRRGRCLRQHIPGRQRFVTAQDQLRGPRVRHRYAQRVVDRDDPRRHIGEDARAPLPRFLERALTASHVGDHAVERGEHRLEFTRRPRRERRRLTAASDGERRRPQRRDRLGKPPRREAREVDRRDEADQGAQHEPQHEILLLFAHPLVVEELRRREHRLLTRRTGSDHAIADARAPAGRARVHRQLELIRERHAIGRRGQKRIDQAQLRQDG